MKTNRIFLFLFEDIGQLERNSSPNIHQWKVKIHFFFSHKSRFTSVRWVGWNVMGGQNKWSWRVVLLFRIVEQFSTLVCTILDWYHTIQYILLPYVPYWCDSECTVPYHRSTPIKKERADGSHPGCYNNRDQNRIVVAFGCSISLPSTSLEGEWSERS